MTGDEREGVGPPQPVLDVVADPSQGRHRLPYLLGVLDDGDATDRLTAATAVCLVAEAYPDMLPYVVERLVDRLGDDAPVEVGHALDYLAAGNPREVDETVSAMDEADEGRARRALYQSGGGFARSEYLRPGPDDRGAGRTRLAGTSGAADPRQVRTIEPDGETDPLVETDETADEDAETGERDGGSAEGDGAVEVDEDDGAAEEDADGDGPAADRPERRSVTRGTLSLVADRLSEVIERSRFEALDVLSERRRGRFGEVYRAAGRLDGEDVGVALVVFHLPGGDSQSFLASLRGALARWDGVDDHDSVLTVHDWGLRPRPWAALAFTDETLADRPFADRPGPDGDGTGDGGRTDGRARPSLDAVVSTTLDLADGLVHAHQHGVVHGALDPETVAFPGTALTAHERQRPFVTYPGVTAAYAGNADVADYIDPRYAAPEYFDDRFGAVDHATDVYGLGLLCYRLVTGEHPYRGSLSEVREAVVDDRSLRPSAVDPSLPPALDRVVGKATATRKLKRYETITVFRRELRSVDTHGQ